MRRFTQGGDTEMERFREDNTEGYSAIDLVELNKRYRLECMTVNPDDLYVKSITDNIAERIQSEYDTEMSAPDSPTWENFK